jgi:hypothetical protein
MPTEYYTIKQRFCKTAKMQKVWARANGTFFKTPDNSGVMGKVLPVPLCGHWFAIFCLTAPPH